MTKLKKFMRLLQLINQLYKSPPKNIEQIGNLLEVSSRSVYRYLELLEISGFHVKKNDKNKYYIDNARDIPQMVFSEEESEQINNAISLYCRDNKLLGSIRTKLGIVSSAILSAEHINSAKLGLIVATINEGINAKKQIILKKYQSINSQTISDRKVEPISLDGNYRTLTAYELSSKTNKTFVIERVEAVEITPVSFKHEKEHLQLEKDVFGFGTRTDLKSFPVHLELSLKAKVLLTEEYPASTPYIKKRSNSETYIFKCTINDPRPLMRFINGMPEAIKELKGHDMIGERC